MKSVLGVLCLDQPRSGVEIDQSLHFTQIFQSSKLSYMWMCPGIFEGLVSKLPLVTVIRESLREYSRFDFIFTTVCTAGCTVY